jgi:hypothetical protein
MFMALSPKSSCCLSHIKFNWRTLQVAAHVGWPPEDGLTTLPGFQGPWQRALSKGRVLQPTDTLQQAGLVDGATVTVVRIELIAEGWKVRLWCARLWQHVLPCMRHGVGCASFRWGVLPGHLCGCGATSTVYSCLQAPVLRCHGCSRVSRAGTLCHKWHITAPAACLLRGRAS